MVFKTIKGRKVNFSKGDRISTRFTNRKGTITDIKKTKFPEFNIATVKFDRENFSRNAPKESFRITTIRTDDLVKVKK